MTSTRQTSTVTFAFEGQAGMEADMMVPQQGEAVILCVRLIAGVNESAIVELQNDFCGPIQTVLPIENKSKRMMTFWRSSCLAVVEEHRQ